MTAGLLRFLCPRDVIIVIVYLAMAVSPPIGHKYYVSTLPREGVK